MSVKYIFKNKLSFIFEQQIIVYEFQLNLIIPVTEILSQCSL